MATVITTLASMLIVRLPWEFGAISEDGSVCCEVGAEVVTRNRGGPAIRFQFGDPIVAGCAA